MNPNPLGENPPPDNQLQCESIVYRVALDETWFAPDHLGVDAVAFYRRRGRDLNGISIARTEYAYRSYLTEPVNGIISVHVGRVRDVSDAELVAPLDVRIDDEPHGNIVNVPEKVKRGPQRRLADRIASQLAKTAARVHLVFDPPHN